MKDKWWFDTAYDEVMHESEDHHDQPDDDGCELSTEELRHLRRIMKADERARWFWSTIRTFALWITAVSVAAVALRNTIIELFGKH